MKKTIFALAIVIFSVSIHAQQEAAKPIYKIESFREGISIGSFNVELFPLIAPKAVRYFDSLVTIKFYDSTAFHRVVPAFVIQGGDPNSKHLPRETWGNGDPNQTNVPAEFSNVSYVRGVLGAARDTDPNSANSQFFICVANATSLNAQYTAYGKVISGMNICDSIVASPRDVNDNPLKKIDMFVTKVGTNDSVPSVPFMLNPANNANRITLDSNLVWSSVSGGVLYQLDIATDSNFTAKIFSAELGSSSYTLKSVQLGLRKYYWRVSSNNGGHRSAFSSIRSFTTGVSIPTMQSPPTGSTNQPGNVIVKWNKVFGAVSYHLQVATLANFAQTAIVVDQKGGVDTVKQMSGLQLSKKHYWRVSAETPDYEGEFGLQWNFSTGTSTSATISQEIPKQFSLDQNYPNPFNPTTTISYHLPVFGFVSLKIFDLLGKEITALVNESKEPGSYSVTFDASNLVSGIYFYTLSAGEFIQTKKLILMK
jgi:peptidyl-prolyl cis-trans isomerase B (cyclophilin B)